MSGHSKWSTIKRQKGANDAKRGQLFTKLSMAITLAVKEGGGVSDPNGNPRLRLAVDAARAANMPKDNIDRAIQRAVGKQGSEVTEVVYEGFGPGGFSVIVEAVTDNKQRTTPIVKNAFEKNGGTIGNPGSVAYQFEQKGQVTVTKNSHSLDDIYLLAADSGAEDVEDAGAEVLIYTSTQDLGKVRDSLSAQGIAIIGAELIRKPTVMTEVADPDMAKKVLTFMERIEELDDVQKVYANFDMPDDLIKSGGV